MTGVTDAAVDAELEPEVTGARVARNTVFNGADRFVGAILALLLTPFLLHNLGNEEYGIWALATALTFGSGYLSLADLGLQQASVRFIAAARSRGDRAAVSEIVSVTFFFYLALGVLLAVVIAASASLLATLFNVSEDFQHTATIVFVLVGVQVAADLPAASLFGVLEGAQRYGAIRAIDISDRLVWAGLSVVLVLRGHGVTALAAVSLVIALAVFLVTYVAAKRTEPSLRLDPRLMNMHTLRTTFRSSSSMMGLRVLGVLYSQMDRTIIGIMLAASAVASYEVAWKIHSLAAIVLGIAPSAVMPAAAYLHASSDRERLRDLYLRGTRYAVGLCLPLCVAGMIYARDIIRTWVGAEYVDVTSSARLFLVYPALAIALVVGQSMLIGLGRMRRMLSFHAIAVALNLVISISLVHWLGIAGVIWGTIAAYVVLWIPFTRLFLDEFGVSVGDWSSHILLPVVPAVIAQTVLGVASLQWVDGFDRLWQVGFVFAVDYAVAVLVFVAIGGRDELSRLRAMLSRSSVPAAST